MLPADIVGTMIYNPQDGAFRTKHGPIFSNLILADEINRAPAKVQSALLEAMQERQVTIGDETYPLPNPFLVLATQNPLEQEGTYPLPEAQIDRFMMKVIVELSEPRRGARDSGRDGDHRAHAFVPRPWSARPQIVDARHVVNASVRRRQDSRLHRRSRARDAAADRRVAEFERLHPKRRLAARDHRADAGRARHGVPQRPALRHAAGRQDRRAGRAAASRVGDLRGGGRERHSENVIEKILNALPVP
jgi:MoxR-like ATPase